MLVRGLGARYVLVGDDFRFGARRAGDYAMLDAAGQAAGFDVARMNSYEVHGAARLELGGARGAGRGDMDGGRGAARPALQHQRPRGPRPQARPHARRERAGRDDGLRTLNLRFPHWKPAASGIFAVRVHGLADAPLAGVASLGIAADRRRQRPRAARDALPRVARRPGRRRGLR